MVYSINTVRLATVGRQGVTILNPLSGSSTSEKNCCKASGLPPTDASPVTTKRKMPDLS